MCNNLKYVCATTLKHVQQLKTRQYVQQLKSISALCDLMHMHFSINLIGRKTRN